MEILNLPISSVKPSPMNPRKTFDEAALQELADNIRKQGLLQPITVRPKSYWDEVDMESGEITSTPTSYEVVCGERRYRACVLNGAETISAIVREMTDDEAFDAMITENLQRKDVDPIEEAYAFGQLVSKGTTAEEIAARFGKSIRFVQDRIKLNSLIPELLLAVRDERLPISAAMVICKLDEASQEKFAKQFSEGTVTKNQAQNFVSNLFMMLSRSPWFKDGHRDFPGGCGQKCDGCPFNTSSHSCLFYEMNTTDETAQCTNRDKYESKTIAYLVEQVEAYKDDLVLKGAPLEFGKCIIVDNYCKGYYNIMERTHEQVLQILTDKGYEIVTSSVFGPRCYYAKNDERLQEKIDSGELYKCISFCGEYGSSAEVMPIYYRFKNVVSETADGETEKLSPQSVEAMKLVEKYKATQEKGITKYTTWLKDSIGLQYGDEFDTPDRPLSDVEMQMAVVCMLVMGGREAAMKYGIKILSDNSILKTVVENPHLRAKIVRDFMRFAVKTYGVVNANIVEVSKVLTGLWLPDELKKFTEAHQADQDKKLGKIADKLKDLGYGTDGKLLEFKDTTHYAQD